MNIVDARYVVAVSIQIMVIVVNESVVIIVDTTYNVVVVHIDVLNIKVYITETMKTYTVLDRLVWCVELVVDGTFVDMVSIDEPTFVNVTFFVSTEPSVLFLVTIKTFFALLWRMSSAE